MRQLVTLYPQFGSREKWHSAVQVHLHFCPFSLFHSVEHPSQWDSATHIQRASLSSVQPNRKQPHKHAQGCVKSYVIQNLVRLTVSINHHSVITAQLKQRREEKILVPGDSSFHVLRPSPEPHVT